MKVVIGGAYAGKTDFVKKKWGYPDAEISDLPGKKVLNHFHLLVKGMLDRGQDLAEIKKLLSETEVLICDEIGCGIVPAEKEERVYRETVGRLMCGICASAEKVVRVYCGLEEVLK